MKSCLGYSPTLENSLLIIRGSRGRRVQHGFGKARAGGFSPRSDDWALNGWGAAREPFWPWTPETSLPRGRDDCTGLPMSSIGQHVSTAIWRPLRSCGPLIFPPALLLGLACRSPYNGKHIVRFQNRNNARKAIAKLAAALTLGGCAICRCVSPSTGRGCRRGARRILPRRIHAGRSNPTGRKFGE